MPQLSCLGAIFFFTHDGQMETEVNGQSLFAQESRA